MQYSLWCVVWWVISICIYYIVEIQTTVYRNFIIKLCACI